MLYENARVEEIKVDFNNEVQSDDEFIGRSHSLQDQWSASVASVCAEIASFDPRLYGTVRSEKKKQIYAAKEKEWSNIPSLPFDDSEVALAEVPPDSLPAFQAMGWDTGRQGVDIRPHLWDPKEDRFMLVDSGSQCCAWPPDPGDKVDPNMTLRAVNGSKLKCYGLKDVEIKLGRKTFKMKVIKADVQNPIIGWNFIKRYRLAMDWNQWGDVCLVDKVSKIKSVLHYKSIPFHHSRGLSSLRLDDAPKTYFDQSPTQTVFDVAAMTALTEPSSDSLAGVENKIDDMEDGKYKTLLKKFPNILKLSFSKDSSDNGILHRIHVDPEAKPVRAKLRKLLPGSPKEIAAKKAWQELVDLGVVEPVDPAKQTSWVSPVHFVDKPDKSLRVVGDYRCLNIKTQLDMFPLPNLRGYTEKIAGAKIFSKVDLKKAFHLLVIDPRDRHFTCVNTPWGMFNFKRLSMGMKNAAQSFQRLLEHILKGLSNVFCYLDDVLVYNETEEEHLKTLEELYKRLESAGMTLALSKCEFGKSQLDYLGYTVNSSGIAPIKKKIEAVVNFPQPRKQKQLLAFLGALNYYRTSLPSLPPDQHHDHVRTPAEVLDPLYKLATCEISKKSTGFQEIWGNSPAVQESFKLSKQLLQDAVTLNYPDPRAPLALSTDASNFALGGSLDQYVNGSWRPLGFWSKSLTRQQSQYSTFRREAMAVQLAMRHFHDLFDGRDLIVFSDHKPLVHAFKHQDPQLHDPIALRAINEIGMYTSDVRYKEGKDLIVPDLLSRPPGCPIGH